MQDDDLEALAAEYVLGTLAADERGQAEALLRVDAGFVDIVHRWERRLGELNVMVEAVEPPAELWDKLNSSIATLAAADKVSLAPSEPEQVSAEAEAETKPAADTDPAESPLVAALASALAQPEGEAATKAEAEPAPKTETKTKPGRAARPAAPRPDVKMQTGAADVFQLANRLRRWRSIAIVTGLIAAALIVFVVVTQVAPEIIPAGKVQMPQLFAPPTAANAPQGNRLVAVLQHDPAAPGFLLTVDPVSRTLTVRRLTAATDAAHSYQLWLMSPSAAPASLGIVGADEFTRRALPASVQTMRAASYEITFEPAGGSKTGAPSGPILFTGKIVESVPETPPPSQ